MRLDEWRQLQQEGDEAELPSGLTIRVKHVSIFDLAAQGKIPQHLAGQVEKLMRGDRVRNISIAEFQSFEGLINVVCGVAIVEPSREEMEVTELPYLDRLAVFNWANTAKQLDTFRPKQNGTVEFAHSGDDVWDEAE